MRHVSYVALSVGLFLGGRCLAAGPDYRATLKAIAYEIEALKVEFPQLGAFSAAENLDPERLVIEYRFRTHQATHTGGWSSGVPNPDRDGIWLYIDLHDTGSTAQIHAQPVVSTKIRIGDKQALLLVLEGEETRPAEARIWEIVRHHAQKLVESAGKATVVDPRANDGGAAGTIDPATTLTLRVSPEAVVPPFFPRLWLIVENFGKATVRLIRLRQNMIDLYGSWEGWTLSVTGPRGQMRPEPLDGVVMGPTLADCIELKPGESFGVRIGIDRWFRADAKSGDVFTRLADSPGEYSLQVVYTTPKNPFWWLDPKTADTNLTPISGLRSPPATVTVPPPSAADIRAMVRAARAFMTAQTPENLAQYACSEIEVRVGPPELTYSMAFARERFAELMRIKKIPLAKNDPEAYRFGAGDHCCGVFCRETKDTLLFKKIGGEWRVSEITFLPD